jgi:type 1 glutamine amidotransferase
VPAYRRLFRWGRLAAATLALLCLAAPGAQATRTARTAGTAVPYKVLVFSRTTGYHHASIPAGVAAIRALGGQHGFTVDATANPAVFTDAGLSRYATVVFLSTSGEPVTSAAGRAAFQRFVERGGGFVGVHAASDGGWSWPWFGRLVGAYFAGHPRPQLALVRVEDHHNPATAGLTDRYRLDEWYDFRTDPRALVHVLVDVDGSSYTGSAMGADHPLTWCHHFDGGRSFYTALGHSTASFSDPFVLRQLLGGIQWTAGVRPADCSVG